MLRHNLICVSLNLEFILYILNPNYICSSVTSVMLEPAGNFSHGLPNIES